MTGKIASVLKAKLADLVWLERFAGLVTAAAKPKYSTRDGGVQIQTGTEVWPVACDVTAAACWDDGIYKQLAPDSNVPAVAFFVDQNGATFKEFVGGKRARIRYSFELKFLVWLNQQRIRTKASVWGDPTGWTVWGDPGASEQIGDPSAGYWSLRDCNVAGVLAPYIIAQLQGSQSAVGVFNGGIEETMFQQIEVNTIRQLPKQPSMFEPFTFAQTGNTKGLFLYPYDYLGLVLSGTFDVNTKCLPTFDPDTTPPDCLTV